MLAVSKDNNINFSSWKLESFFSFLSLKLDESDSFSKG